MDENARRRQEDWENGLKAWKAKQGKERYPRVNKNMPMEQHNIEKEENSSPGLTKFLIFLAFAIPIAILGYALYINYLPFGYENTYTLTVDEEGILTPLNVFVFTIV